jgi:hypothetical protein
LRLVRQRVRRAQRRDADVQQRLVRVHVQRADLRVLRKPNDLLQHLERSEQLRNLRKQMHGSNGRGRDVHRGCLRRQLPQW